ncbi:MAG: hypothetical protein J4F29_02175 [Candidatus Latescibacteria bacterium]|nr:hypothetical protein [Candidatus Latescibacterota bacterium]
MIKKRFLLIFLAVASLSGCNTGKRNPLGEGFVGRDPGDTVALPAVPLKSARSFHSLTFPTVMGEQEELLVGQMNGFLLRSLLRFNVPDELSGGVPPGLVLDSLRVNLGIRSARLVENASLIALRPDSPWEELQTYVDTLSLVESEVLATPIPDAVVHVFEDRVRIDLPVSLLKDAVEAGATSVEILLQPDGEKPFLLDIFAREANAIRADAPIPELEAVYRVGDVIERAAVQTSADTYWSARVNGGPSEDLIILSEGLFYGSVLNFDLPDIPQGATINSAQLQLDINLDRSYFSSFPFEIYGLTIAEGDTAFTRYNEPLLLEPTTATYTINHTLIQAWISGARLNHGLALSPLNFTSTTGLPALLNSPPLIRWLVLKDVRLNLIYSFPPEL